MRRALSAVKGARLKTPRFFSHRARPKPLSRVREKEGPNPKGWEGEGSQARPDRVFFNTPIKTLLTVSSNETLLQKIPGTRL
jgi:hypothetical protein